MTERYLCTGSGTKDGKAYATLARIVEGKKNNGDRYCFIDSNRTMREEEEIPVGTIIDYKTSRTLITSTSTAGFPTDNTRTTK